MMAIAFYVLAAFGSAMLLFSAETFFAKMLLPLLGGTPSVWNASVFFYELLVLAAYGYVHWSTALMGVRRQLLLHVTLLVAALAILPLHLQAGAAPPQDADPIPWLLLTLTSAVAVPLLLIASSGPLLQAYFSCTDHPAAKSPYFIYSASNAGSMAILIAYPIVIEPFLTLSQQTHVWMWCYCAEILLIGVCGSFVMASRTTAVRSPVERGPARRTAPTALKRMEWVVLALLPSSLSLGATTFISSDIAVIPLLWVLPLAIYLLTFAMAFAHRPLVSIPTQLRVWPICVTAVSVTLLGNATLPVGITIILHLATLFAAALLCHSYLSASKPPADGLTEFYVWVALGGLLGGAFNSLIAPYVFKSVAEYPFVLAGILLRAGDQDRKGAHAFLGSGGRDGRVERRVDRRGRTVGDAYSCDGGRVAQADCLQCPGAAVLFHVAAAARLRRVRGGPSGNRPVIPDGRQPCPVLRAQFLWNKRGHCRRRWKVPHAGERDHIARNAEPLSRAKAGAVDLLSPDRAGGRCLRAVRRTLIAAGRGNRAGCGLAGGLFAARSVLVLL